ncbi:signal transduction histidine kinase/PAS domain-containing protein [Actinoplanes lutulentus]|uniref:histidine kinase n=1 Tax=Actinoplanes lutulentus TaxID=1287878 RepID=A0A327Z138_9ACTN|nr:ATP-binding protein [Actinoplanes lutulentus]MBB2948648.1 signal transduction histidine kinase/PAS domain-containing protein [Actinoplanes lutulentus]RAK27981.1 PAS domain-containing protein [Actinoplanes lutulentus]
MVLLDEAVLGNPIRLEAVERALRTLPGRTTDPDDVATLAARLLDAPLAAVTLVGGDVEHILGMHGLPEPFRSTRRVPMAYSVCKYAVSTDHVVRCGDMAAETDAEFRDHPIVREYGLRAFVTVPIRNEDDRPIGSLTVLDTRPRDWTGEQADTLVTIAGTLLGPSADPEVTALDDGAFLGALLQSLDAGVIACNATGRVVFVNRAMREARGLPPDGPIPQDYEDQTIGVLTGPDERPLPWEQTPLIRALHGEQVLSEDVHAHLAGHRCRIFATTARPIVGAGGRLLGAVAVAHEATALRRAERFRACHLAVEHVLKRAGTVAEAAPEALRAVTGTLGWPAAELFLVDDTTGSLEAVGHWDSSGFDPDGFFGHTPIPGEGITGRAWQNGRAIWVPDIALSQDLRTAHERERVEICLRRGVRTALAVPVRDGGTLLGVMTCYAGTQEYEPDLLTVLLDGVAAQIGVFVSRRRAEEIGRQLNRAQNDFVDLVGHELRTPLTSITANATILAEEMAGLDDDCRQMARVIARNAEVLQRIAGTLLDLAGLDAGHLVLDVHPVDLASLVADAVTTARHGADRLTLVTEVPAELILPADAARLRQVVLDLLSNAIRYSPPGAPVHVMLRAEGATADLRIADMGIGTPAAERARLFDRFFRGSNVRHQGTSGSGLGLSLARAIVLLHGGTIRLEENRPSGTVVSVRLPLTGPPVS